MKNESKTAIYLLTWAFCIVELSIVGSTVHAASPKRGEAEFKEYCAACHSDGGNIINPAKTLSKKDREMNGIKTSKDIIKIMRKPGEGMTTFDDKTLPDKEANRIADYIIGNFK